LAQLDILVNNIVNFIALVTL